MKTREVGSRGSITAFSSPLSRRENAVGENAADELVHAIPALLPLLIVPSFSAAPPCLLRQSHLIPPPVHTQRRRQDSRRPPHGALLLRFQQQGFTAGGPTASPRPPVRVRAGAGPRYGSAGAAAVPGQGPRHRPHRLRPVHRRRSQGQDGRAGREGGRAGRALQEDGGRAARQRAGPAQLRAVPARGEGRSQEGRGVLLPRHARGPQRRRDHVAVRQAGLGGAPRPGAIPQLLPQVRAGCPAE